MNHAILAAGLVAASVAPAAANPFAGLLDFTAQIRAQSTLVEAHTAAIFDDLPRGRILADDVYDELEDICRELNRLEADLTRSRVTRGLIRRLEHRAQEIDEEACELADAVEDAIRDANRRARHGVNRVRPIPHHPTNFAVTPGVTRGVSVSAGARGLRVSVGHPALPNYATNRAFVGRNAAYVRPIGFGRRDGCISPAQARALRIETERLRLMTKQLVAILCD